MPNKDLEGKVAIVTGAGSGIGTGISKILHDRGATLALCDLYGESAEKTAKSLSKEFIYDSVDVTKLSDIENFRDKTINKFGKIDILVSNAGVIGAEGFAERKNYSKKDWDDTFDVNVIGVVNSADAIVDHMKNNKYGKIVNIASHGGRKPRGLGDMHRGNVQTPYLVSKAAVIQYTHLLAIELGSFNINVNAVCPGVIWTPIWRAIAENHIEQNPNLKGMDPKEVFDELAVKARTPLGRGQTPEDIGKTVAFFASEDSSEITGQALNVNGGASLN
ncbi:MAG: SDR family oxidoreductase [SAR202 cluster bacterium]|nr:SDR family oxidoreductase [SAR202 cluster bacterium]|tara:strand:+ start:8817 stop:9644 length:828 start_codon:yes stop_codon:yes gene_type:complete